MSTVISVVSALCRLYAFLILVRVVLSWVHVDTYQRLDHPILRLLDRLTEPILATLRRVVPPFGSVDVTPIVAMILIELFRLLIVSLLQRI